jgi:hypothetical protein
VTVEEEKSRKTALVGLLWITFLFVVEKRPYKKKYLIKSIG